MAKFIELTEYENDVLFSLNVDCISRFAAHTESYGDFTRIYLINEKGFADVKDCYDEVKTKIENSNLNHEFY